MMKNICGAKKNLCLYPAWPTNLLASGTSGTSGSGSGGGGTCCVAQATTGGITVRRHLISHC